MDKNKTKECLDICHKVFQKQAECQARIQNDVKHIVETFCTPFIKMEVYNKKYFNKF